MKTKKPLLLGQAAEVLKKQGLPLKYKQTQQIWTPGVLTAGVGLPGLCPGKFSLPVSCEVSVP